MSINRQHLRITLFSIGTLVLTAGALPAQAHPHPDILCWVAAEYDLDEDGFADYFAHKDDRVSISSDDYTDAEAMTCPAGYVMARGDVDDSDPNVRPRRQEVAFNDIDDDGDGRIDEPTLYYSSNGFDNTNTAFTMQVRIHDDLPIAVYASPAWDLMARIEYQKLQNTDVTHVSTKLVSHLWSYAPYSRTDVRVTGLEPGTAYRARIQFRARYKWNHHLQFDIGENTTWYYTMTDSDHSMVKVRQRIVLRALYETYLSERSITGYLGTYTDGTRYGGNPGEWWCSEFYSWVTNFDIEGMGHRSNTGSLRTFFEDHYAWAELPDDYSYLVGFYGPGDYLGIGADEDNLKHSAMFLAYEPARDIVWSIEGNVSGRSDIGDSYASRRGGNEARVVQRGSDTVGGLGRLKWGMVRD